MLLAHQLTCSLFTNSKSVEWYRKLAWLRFDFIIYVVLLKMGGFKKSEE